MRPVLGRLGRLTPGFFSAKPHIMQTVFVSGGAGFIGSHLTKRLLADPAVRQVVIYDNFSSGTRRHLQESAADPRLKVIEADIKDLAKITAAMAGADTVFHLAANPDIAKAVTQPDIDFWEGTYLAQNMLEAMRVNGVKRLLYMSGSGIYGENARVAFAENYGPCLPISTYGASKLACEALICAYCHMFDLTARAFRFANVVGPRQTHGVGYDFVRRLKKRSLPAPHPRRRFAEQELHSRGGYPRGGVPGQRALPGALRRFQRGHGRLYHGQ